MPLRSLPPIFARVRGGLPREKLPPVVVSLTMELLDEAAAYLRDLVHSGDDTAYERLMGEAGEFFAGPNWNHVWFEGPSSGKLIYGGNLYHWHKNEKRCRKIDLSLQAENPDALEEQDRLRCLQLHFSTTAVYLATERPAEISVNTLTRNAPRQFVRQGDTLRYAPLSSLASSAGQSRQRDYEPPEEPSGIRMREHDVRGHWRTYSSGVRVWVRSHKRGDPELGRVTRVIGDG